MPLFRSFIARAPHALAQVDTESILEAKLARGQRAKYLHRAERQLFEGAALQLCLFPAAETGVRHVVRPAARRSDLDLFEGTWNRILRIEAPPSVAPALREAPRRLESAFRDCDALDRAVVESAPDGVLVVDESLQIVAANPAACRLLARSEEALAHVGLEGEIEAGDGSLRALVDHARRLGRARGDVVLVRGDGARFPAEITSSAFRDGIGRERTSLFVRDLTESKQAEDRLRFVADAATQLAESLDFDETLRTLGRLLVPRLADVCVVDLHDGQHLARAAVFARKSSRAAEVEALRRCAPDLDPLGAISRVQRTGRAEVVGSLGEEWLRALTSSDDELTAARAAGAGAAIVVPMTTGGRTIGVLSLATIGRARAHEGAELTVAGVLAQRAAVALAHARAHEAAVQARRTRDELLAVVAHDLRAPLNVIGLSASVLERAARSTESSAILRAVSRANRLIQDLLTTARIESGHLPLQRALEPPSAMLGAVLDLFGAHAREKGIALDARLETRLPAIWVDRHRILQVLANLLGNALKFTRKGGRIEVRVRRHDADGVCFEVHDDGVGIAPESLPHVFDRFWQASHARRAGAGLGLAIAGGDRRGARRHDRRRERARARLDVPRRAADEAPRRARPRVDAVALTGSTRSGSRAARSRTSRARGCTRRARTSAGRLRRR